MAALTKRTTGKGISWRVLIRLNGHEPLCKTFAAGKTKKEDDAAHLAALQWAKDAEAAMKSGRPMENKETFNALVARFNADPTRAKLVTLDRVTKHLAEWAEVFGEYRVSAISRAMVREQLAKFIATKIPARLGVPAHARAAATINRRKASLRGFFKWCIEQDIIEINPAANIKRQQEPEGRTRFLSDEERIALFDACTKVGCPMLAPLVIMATYTGMRREELMRLDWSSVDLNKGTALVLKSKNGKKRNVKVAGLAIEALRAWKLESAPVSFIGPRKVFPGPYPKHAWTRARKLAGVRDLCFHSLRHTAASYAAMSGFSIVDLMEFLGHKAPGTVKRYAHLTEAHIAGKVEEMAERFR